MSETITFSVLFRQAWQTMQLHIRQYVLTAVIAGLLLACMHALWQKALRAEVQSSLVQVEDELGMEPQHIQSLFQQYDQGDHTALFELLHELEGAKQRFFSLHDAEKLALIERHVTRSFLDLLPSIVLLSLSVSITSFVAVTYFFILAAERGKTPVFMRSLKLLMPFIGLSLWVSLRSFGWVPFIGPILAIVFLPRFALAPVLMVQEHLGILRSTRESYLLSRGHWWKIVHTLALVVALSVLCSIGIVIAANVSTFISWWFPLVLHGVLTMLLLGFVVTIYVRLCEGVLENVKLQ